MGANRLGGIPQQQTNDAVPVLNWCRIALYPLQQVERPQGRREPVVCNSVSTIHDERNSPRLCRFFQSQSHLSHEAMVSAAVTRQRQRPHATRDEVGVFDKIVAAHLGHVSAVTLSHLAIVPIPCFGTLRIRPKSLADYPQSRQKSLCPN